jgi:Na+-transporting NADH:ubiquinone oxidoreductase subunit C
MKKRLFSIAYMFFITLFFTSVVSGVKVLNEERIESNQKARLRRIILSVLQIPEKGEPSDEMLDQIFQTRIRSIQVEGTTLYLGFEENGKTILGYAFPVGGPGFWGPIFGMVAVNSNASKILGIAFYKHAETPGLGARITTEDWFKDQFKDLPIYPVEKGKKIFYLKPEGTGEAPNELDAVTGATGTSRAVEGFLNKGLDRYLREVWKSVKKG